MRSRNLGWSTRGAAVASCLAFAVLEAGIAGAVDAHGAEQPRMPSRFEGLINDYTPPAPTVTGGPYEMHGRWSLTLSEEHDSAIFAAEMTMQTSDFANTDPGHDPTKLGPHTHHLSVRDGVLHKDPADPINWKTQCPAFKPAVTDGFVVIGTAYVTGNGGNPPFGNPSPVTICILGGTQNPAVTGVQAFVEFSNFTLQFGVGSRASIHFGTQAINGVVAECESPGRRASSDCKVTIAD